jgi:GTP cyclohydrolase I
MTMAEHAMNAVSAPPLHAVHESGIDRERAERAVAELLTALGRDPRAVHLADTPRRVTAAFTELLTPPEFEFTTFPNDSGYDGLVLVTDIPFHSLCAHHLLPFEGTAHIGYLPGERIVGLSKLARALEYFARDLQVQERLTADVAAWLDDRLAPRGVGVVLEARHLCMSLRGVRVAGARTVTTTLLGELRHDRLARQEFLDGVPTARRGTAHGMARHDGRDSIGEE